MNNVLKVLGLFGVSDTLVGDGAIRGISGGQKRRVTLGEMLMPNRKILFMDAISNGLDAATTYDIVQSLSYVTKTLDLTTVISLLQVYLTRIYVGCAHFISICQNFFLLFFFITFRCTNMNSACTCSVLHF